MRYETGGVYEEEDISLVNVYAVYAHVFFLIAWSEFKRRGRLPSERNPLDH